MDSSLDPNRNPKHVAIIMDGNGRWATQRGLERHQGHEQGALSVRTIVESCARLNIPYLTLYAFSTENWNRPQTEVQALMDLLVRYIELETPRLIQNGIRLNAIGDLQSLRPDTLRALETCIAQTAHLGQMTLSLALSYSARWELTQMAQRIAQDCSQGLIQCQHINEDLIRARLCTHNLPDPDLLIRTGGEIRVSNFLLWQIAYSELYFTDTLWPDFREPELITALKDFQLRERRFGKTSQQIQEQPDTNPL